MDRDRQRDGRMEGRDTGPSPNPEKGTERAQRWGYSEKQAVKNLGSVSVGWGWGLHNPQECVIRR